MSSPYPEGTQQQCWRIRNTFLEFYDGEDDDFSDLAAPSRQRSASAGPVPTPTSRNSITSYTSTSAKKNEMEQVLEARGCQDRFGMEKSGQMDKNVVQTVPQEVPVTKRGGGVRGPYHVVEPFRAPEEANRDIKKGDDAVVLSLANLTTPPTESSKDEVVPTQQRDNDIQEPPTDVVGGGNAADKEGDVTTAMIRHIACRYTQEDIASFLNEAGFAGKYNWIYLPLNPQKTANLGYVFVNFVSPENLDECRDLLDNQVFGPSQTTKRCQVTMALLQGPRIQRRSRRKVKDKNQQAALAAASGEADRQSCPRGSMDSCTTGATLETADPHPVVGA